MSKKRISGADPFSGVENNTTATDALAFLLGADDGQEDMVDYQPRERRRERVNEQNALVVSGDGYLRYGNAQLSQVGIENLDELSADDLDALGHVLFTVDDAVQWWVGDWLNRMPRAWGDTYEAVAERTGREIETLYHYASVSRSIPIHIRRANLSYSHHRAVSMMSHQEQAYWLQHAESENLSVRKLKQAIKNVNAQGSGSSLPEWRKPTTQAFKIYGSRWAKMTREQRETVYNDYVLLLEQMQEWGFDE